LESKTRPYPLRLQQQAANHTKAQNSLGNGVSCLPGLPLLRSGPRP